MEFGIFFFGHDNCAYTPLSKSPCFRKTHILLIKNRIIIFEQGTFEWPLELSSVNYRKKIQSLEQSSKATGCQWVCVSAYMIVCLFVFSLIHPKRLALILLKLTTKFVVVAQPLVIGC